MNILHRGTKDTLDYALIADISPDEAKNSCLVDVPTFFDICHYASKKDQELFTKMPGSYAGYFLTATALEVGQRGVRVRHDTNIDQSKGWSSLIAYPWEEINFVSFRKKERATLETHPLFRGLFGQRTAGLYGFGYQYARDAFDIRFAGEFNDLPVRHAACLVDMAPNDGENRGVISLAFEEFPLKGKYACIARV